jgi:hypothetical protein
MEISGGQLDPTDKAGRVVGYASAAALSVIDRQSFEKLLSAMHWLGLQVCDRTTRWADVVASPEYESILNACENIVIAGDGKLSTTSAQLKRLVVNYAAVVSRPTHACYAGDDVFSGLAKKELMLAYEEALSAVQIQVIQ